MVNAYEPVIRNIHNAVDLSDSLSDFQLFLSDLIKVAKIAPPGKNGETVVPTVGDFVQLLKKHQYSCHKFLHQCCKNGKELTGWYREYIEAAAAQFRRDTTTSDSTIHDAGHLKKPLNELFFSLSPQQQEEFLPLLDAHSKYLDQMHTSSRKRLEAVLKSPPLKHPAIAKVLTASTNSQPSSPTTSLDHAGKSTLSPTLTTASGPPTDPGPGAYLARWQDLLENTPITPLSASGVVKNANSNDVVDRSAKDVDGEQMINLPEGNPGTRKVEVDDRTGGKQDLRPIIEALGKDFRTLLAKRSMYW